MKSKNRVFYIKEKIFDDLPDVNGFSCYLSDYMTPEYCREIEIGFRVDEPEVALTESLLREKLKDLNVPQIDAIIKEVFKA